MDNNKQLIFNYLLTVSNGKLFLSPKQLEIILDITTNQQSELRRNNKFPIPYKKIGKLIFYSINDILDYMIDGKTFNPEPNLINNSIPIKRKNVKDYSSLLMLMSFKSHIDLNIQRLNNISSYLFSRISYIELIEETERDYINDIDKI